MACRWVHAQCIGVGGRTSVYGESQGPGNGSIYLTPSISFSQLTPQLFARDKQSPPEKPSQGAGRPSSVGCCPLRLAALGQPYQLTNVRGDESELLLSPRKLRLCHQTVTFGNRWRSQAGVLPVIQQLASDGCCVPSQKKRTQSFPWQAHFLTRGWQSST